MNTPSAQSKPGLVTRLWQYSRQLLVLALLLIAFVVGFVLRGGGSARDAVATEQWYTCSMHPDVRMPNPDDKCPICGMALEPVSAQGSSGIGTNQVEMSAAAAALIDVQTAPVTRRFVEHQVNMVGRVEYDETRLAYITAFVGGRLDRLFVDYTGIKVRKGDHLAEIYSPSLLIAQQELVAARRAFDRLGADSGDIAQEAAESVLNAAREKLRLLGMTDEQINAAGAGRGSGDHITLYAPTGGVVITKNAKQGSYVKEGDRIYTIADLSQVWVILEAYESDMPWLRYGQHVTFRVQAFGDETFEGRIAFIDPTLDRTKRTVRVRVNVKNDDGRLRPGMFVRATVDAQVAAGGRVIAPELTGKWISPMHPEVVRDEPGVCPVCGMALVKAEQLGYEPVNRDDAEPPLVVPQSAVLRTGQRGVVYVQVSNASSPVFEGRQVELGPRGNGFFIIRSGLHEGELVVARGNFQIDSALQLQAGTSMMNPTTQPAEPTAHLHGDSAEPIWSVLDAYMELASALAGDDMTKAEAAAAALSTSTQAASTASYPQDFQGLWASHVDGMRDAVAKMNEAQDIATLRKSFHAVSDILIGILKRTHIDSNQSLYVAHCPLAFNNSGADWLTSEKVVLNPYFGQSMLRCGSINQTLVMPAAVTQPVTNGRRHE